MIPIWYNSKSQFAIIVHGGWTMQNQCSLHVVLDDLPSFHGLPNLAPNSARSILFSAKTTGTSHPGHRALGALGALLQGQWIWLSCTKNFTTLKLPGEWRIVGDFGGLGMIHPNFSQFWFDYFFWRPLNSWLAVCTCPEFVNPSHPKTQDDQYTLGTGWFIEGSSS